MMVGPNFDWSTTNYTSTATDGQGNSYPSQIRIVYVVQTTPDPSSWMPEPLDDGKPSKRRHHLHLIEPFQPRLQTAVHKDRRHWVPPAFILAPAARYSARS